MSRTADKLEAAREAYQAARDEAERLRAEGDTAGLPAAEAAFAKAREALHVVEAAASAAEHKATRLALARQRDEFLDRQDQIGERQRTVIALIRAYADELRELEAEDRELIAAYELASGVSPLPTAEARWRHRAALPEQILSERVVEKWIAPNGLPVSPDIEGQIEDLGDGKGLYRTRIQTAPVRRLPCKEVSYLAATPPFEPKPLIEGLVVPPPDQPPPGERTPELRIERDHGLRVVKPAAA